MTDDVRAAVRTMTGPAAPPSSNGELVFEEPWHARAFALAVATVEGLAVPWDEFRERLTAAIAEDPHLPYYESWLAALESLALDHGVVGDPDLDHAEAAAAVPMAGDPRHGGR